MPGPRDQLATLLAPFSPRLLDASARGSGWNSVWFLAWKGKPVVLKVYGRRRTRIREWLTHVTQLCGGRTGYTAGARRETERLCLTLWRETGFDVPRIDCEPLPLPPLPAPFLLMEYLPGPSLAAFLSDPSVQPEEKDAGFIRFLSDWGRRHAAALVLSEPALLQEHPGLDHLLVSGIRLATFDLEVAYTSRGRVAEGISAEIAGFVRSLFKSLPEQNARHYLQLLAQAYPSRSRLIRVHTDLFTNPSPVRRLFHALDRRLLRKPGRLDKYVAAERLREALVAGKKERHPCDV
jgi:hypothetical protein